MHPLKRIILIGFLGIIAFGPHLASKQHKSTACPVPAERTADTDDDGEVEAALKPVNLIVDQALTHIVWNIR